MSSAKYMYMYSVHGAPYSRMYICYISQVEAQATVKASQIRALSRANPDGSPGCVSQPPSPVPPAVGSSGAVWSLLKLVT